MVDFYWPEASTFGPQHQPNVIQQLKPWARSRKPNLDIQLTGQTVARNAAIGTVIGTFQATGGKTVYQFSLTNNDSGNFGVVSSDLRTLVTPLTPGPHTIIAHVLDGVGNTFDETMTITVT